MRSIVKAVNLNKYYDQYHALRDINIEVEQGEVMCIIGPSGSGKSTLLRCVNQLEKIDKGGLWVDGVLVGYRVLGNKLGELLANVSDVANTAMQTQVDTHRQLKTLAEAVSRKKRRIPIRDANGDIVEVREVDDDMEDAMRGGADLPPAVPAMPAVGGAMGGM